MCTVNNVNFTLLVRQVIFNRTLIANYIYIKLLLHAIVRQSLQAPMDPEDICWSGSSLFPNNSWE